MGGAAGAGGPAGSARARGKRSAGPYWIRPTVRPSSATSRLPPGPAPPPAPPPPGPRAPVVVRVQLAPRSELVLGLEHPGLPVGRANAGARLPPHAGAAGSRGM